MIITIEIIGESVSLTEALLRGDIDRAMRSALIGICRLEINQIHVFPYSAEEFIRANSVGATLEEVNQLVLAARLRASSERGDTRYDQFEWAAKMFYSVVMLADSLGFTLEELIRQVYLMSEEEA